MTAQSSTLSAMRVYVATVPLTDTHEHLNPETVWLEKPPHLAHFFPHYASSDLVSAGMPPADLNAVKGEQLSHDEAWKLIEPYWERSRNTTYCKSIDIAIRDLFGLPGLSRDTYKPLMERMLEAKRPGWYREVLRERANIEVSILDKTFVNDRSMYVPIYRFDDYITASSRSHLYDLSMNTGVGIYSLDDLLKALDVAFDKAAENRPAGVKVGLAYSRTLFFDHVARHDAEVIFNRAFRQRGEGACWEESKPLQDYMFHQVMRRAMERGWPVQIHTGLQEGNGNFISDSDPVLLSNIFLMYKKLRFDVFHAGFPYSRELSVLAKNFPNVYPDMCWMHIIGAKPARNILDEWLDLIPANKILAFGGDYRFVEGIYAHACIARENVSRVLADRVDRGDQTMDEAKYIAERILRLNARELFGIDEKRLQE